MVFWLIFFLAVAYPGWRVFKGARLLPMFGLTWWLLVVVFSAVIVILPAVVRGYLGTEQGNAVANVLPNGDAITAMLFEGWLLAGGVVAAALGARQWYLKVRPEPRRMTPPPLPVRVTRWQMAVRIAGALVAVLVGFAITLALGAAGMAIGSTMTEPWPPPPKEAKSVYFSDWTAWQSRNYEYRFDAPPDVCKEFAVYLIGRQNEGLKSQVERTEFSEFPLRGKFPAWFDPDSVKRGYLLRAGMTLAVVDEERGRLYYYSGY